MDQVYAERHVCEKYLSKGRDAFWAFIFRKEVWYDSSAWYVADLVSSVEFIYYRSVSNYSLLSKSEKRRYHSVWL